MAENLPTFISKTMSCKFAEQKSATVMHQFVTPELLAKLVEG